MQRLPKKMVKRLEDLKLGLEKALNEADDAFGVAQGKISEAIDELNAKVNGVQIAIGELNNFREDVYDRIEDYVNERSESWQDSDRGTAYLEFAQEWEAEIEEIEEFEVPELEGIEVDVPEWPEEFEYM